METLDITMLIGLVLMVSALVILTDAHGENPAASG